MQQVDHQELVEKLAVKLKEHCTAPDWANYVKTGHGRQRPPIRQDWWQVRSAAILLSVQKLGPVGVSKLTVKYGNRKNKGMKPEREARGSGSVIRTILQQLESAKLIQQAQKGVHKGRIITTKGTRLVIDASKDAATTGKEKPKQAK